MEIKGKKLKVKIWDTAGEERFKNIISNYYIGANGILLLYNITDRDSFDSLNSFLIEIRKNAEKDISIILVGTNCDLEDERIVTYQEGKDFATKNGMKFIEVSAKNNINVKEAFNILLEDILNNISDGNKVYKPKVETSLLEKNKNKKCNII